ncbi:MAG: DUF1566 domain-containing protein [Bacteroidetes bacterium]|nr:DUF1566 domain-containing protein [Bacteroidota bacterium]
MVRVFIFLSLQIILISIFSCTKDDFRWNLVAKPEISKPIITQNSLASLTVQSSLLSNGHDKNTVKGFCWSTQNNPTLSDNKIVMESSKEESFSYTIPWSFIGTIYVRSFAINKLDTVYSEIISTIWTGDAGNIPIVNTLSIEDIQFYNAKINCQLISDGGLTLEERGVFISENPQPNSSNSIKVLDNSSISFFTILAENLIENKTYYVRAFAKNFAFTGLGNVLSFTTKNFYNVGELGPAGGRIFYSKNDTLGGWNFLEAAPQDYNLELKWSPSSITVNNTSTDLGLGESNTSFIINVNGNSILYAAYASSVYSFSGYTDWYLPSRDELIKMYQNLYLNGTGGLALNSQYWSSSEDDFYHQNAWTVKMSGNGEVSTFPKSNMFKSRFIRRF